MNRIKLSQSLSLNSLPKEKWREIKYYEGLYTISNYGRLKSLAKPKNGYKDMIYSVGINNYGYKAVQLSKNGIYYWVLIHRLVGLAFINNPLEKPYINHKNSIRHDNYFKNLEWCTTLENIHHGMEYGNIASIKGEKNMKAVLSVKQVREILSSSLSNKNLAIKYSVNVVSIQCVKNGKTWSHISNIINQRRKLFADNVLKIFLSDKTTAEISNQFNVKESTIRAIKTGQNGGAITGKKYTPKHFTS